jgi:hypothetical protein
MDEESVFEQFRSGVLVIAIDGTGTGVSKGVTRNTIGLLRVMVKWDGSGITAETHPSQITPPPKGDSHGRKNHDHNGS